MVPALATASLGPRMTNRGLGVGVWSVWACGVALAVSGACGSDDGSKKSPQDYDAEAGAGGRANGGDGNANAAGTAPQAGSNGVTEGGTAGNPGETSGGAPEGGQSSQSGSGGSQSNEAGAGAAGAAGTVGDAGAAGAAGAGNTCEVADPNSSEGIWETNCNGYICRANIAANGALSTACTNGQYASGTLVEDGSFQTMGEGGQYDPFSTYGTFTPQGCETLKDDYIGQIPPLTGPEVTYSCTFTRKPDCAPTLLQALAGTWKTTCGNSTCTTIFTAQGGMSSTCSNGQTSTGTIGPSGAFSDTGSGGNQPAYSTTGVVTLSDCNTLLMPYTYQMPPNQGTKHAQSCTYTRQN